MHERSCVYTGGRGTLNQNQWPVILVSYRLDIGLDSCSGAWREGGWPGYLFALWCVARAATADCLVEIGASRGADGAELQRG